MRSAAFILAFIALWGLVAPQSWLDADKGGGRWLFFLILALAAFSFCRRRRKP